MFITISSLAITTFLWFFAIACLRGCNWVLATGYSTANKETKQKYREKKDVPAMNKYIGKTIFLPMAILMTLFSAILFIDLAPNIVSLVENVLGIFGIAVTILAIKGAVTALLGSRFDKKDGI